MIVAQQIVQMPLPLPAGTRVLIVEDQPFISAAVADMVIALEAEVSEIAETVEGALAAVGRGGFTLALLDIDLDGRPSDAVAGALVAAGKPFLITSGFGGRTIKGFESVPRLGKPYLPSHLSAALAALLTPRADAA